VSPDYRDAYGYQEDAMRTRGPMETREGLALAALGLAGEVGEAVELVKKHLFHGRDFDRAKFSKELGDVAWYLAAACEAAELDLGMVLSENIEKLRNRYPNGFTHADSAARRDLAGSEVAR
jgi:NTP pyrophosphatase (non-canonical NTP hydrolase)